MRLWRETPSFFDIGVRWLDVERENQASMEHAAPAQSLVLAPRRRWSASRYRSVPYGAIPQR